MDVGRRRRVQALAAVIAGAALFAGPARGAVTSLPAQDLHRSDRIEDVAAFAEPTGDVIVAWTGQNGQPTVLAAQKPKDGPFGAVATLSTTPNAENPRFARSPDGTVLVAYSTATNTVPDEFVLRPLGGAFGTPQQFPIGERFVDVGADGAGVATAVWKGNRAGGLNFVATSTAAIGSPFATFEPLTPDADDNFIIPRIAMNASGEAVAAWSREVSPTEDVLEARVRAGGAFGPLQEILRLPANSGPRPAVAIGPSGEAVVVWSREVGADPVVEAAFRAPGSGTLGAVQTLATGASSPQVAMIDGGSAVIAWRKSVGDTEVAQAVVRPPGGPTGPAVDLSEPSAANASLQVAGVAADAGGGALVSWQRGTGATVLAEAARRPSAGPFDPPVLIADMGETGRSLAVAVQPSGGAVAAWRQTASPTEVLLRTGGLQLLPDANTTAADVCGPPPAPAPTGSTRRARFTLTTAQLAINQRIGQAAVRRLNAIAKWLDAGIETRDLCGGTVGPADLAPGIASAPRTASLAVLTAPDPRPVVIATPPRKTARFTLSPAQLLINQRIYQAAVRRANALRQRLASGLTGGDLKDGAVSQAKLHDRLRVVSITPAPAVPASSTNVAAAVRAAPGTVRLSVSQLAVNQRVAQAGVRRANTLLAKLGTGITSADLRDGTIGGADLAPEAMP